MKGTLQILMEEKLERLDQQLETDKKLLAAVKALAAEWRNYHNLPSVKGYIRLANLKDARELPPKYWAIVTRFYYAALQFMKMGLDDRFLAGMIRFVKAKIKDTPRRSLDEEFKRVAQELSVPASRERRWYRTNKKQEERKEENK